MSALDIFRAVYFGFAILCGVFDVFAFALIFWWLDKHFFDPTDADWRS